MFLTRESKNKNMKIVIYTHDTFGLGNIRRMLLIAEHLNQSIKDASILLISSSPMLHAFRLGKGIDYIKLPTISRNIQGEYQTRTLGMTLQDMVKMRADLILSAVRNFSPDVILVDKKPLGLKRELTATLRFLKEQKAPTKVYLVLRDILDRPDVTHRYWRKKGYFNVIEHYYNQVLILGDKTVYDAARLYHFPFACQQLVHYCGYLRRSGEDLKDAQWVRKQLGIGKEKIILLTTGGGADGERILTHFLQFWRRHDLGKDVHAVVVHGPELCPQTQQQITSIAGQCRQVSLLEFTPHLPSFMNAAEVVISMGGYNTLCEALSLNKRILCIPRVTPVSEQLIRASRFAQLGMLQLVHPDELTARKLATALHQLLEEKQTILPGAALSFDALEQIEKQLTKELPNHKLPPPVRLAAQKAAFPAYRVSK